MPRFIRRLQQGRFYFQLGRNTFEWRLPWRKRQTLSPYNHPLVSTIQTIYLRHCAELECGNQRPQRIRAMSDHEFVAWSDKYL